jgi:hypothetical protein
MDKLLEVQLPPCEIYLLQKILDFEGCNKFYASSLANFLGTQPTNPIFYKLMKTLKNLSIVEETEVIGSIKMLKMYYNKLKELYWNQKPVQESIDTFVNHYIASINY